MDLTKRQQEIVDYIKRYRLSTAIRRPCATSARLSAWRRLRRCMPTSRTWSESGCSGVTRPSRARSSRSTARPREYAALRPRLPLVGQVAAGQPVFAEENIEEYIQTPPFAGGAEGEYLLRVRGESMKDVGFLEDDLVVVRPQDTAQDGEIVVALVGEERPWSASSRRTITSGCSPRTYRWTHPQSRLCGSSAA